MAAGGCFKAPSRDPGDLGCAGSRGIPATSAISGPACWLDKLKWDQNNLRGASGAVIMLLLFSPVSYGYNSLCYRRTAWLYRPSHKERLCCFALLIISTVIVSRRCGDRLNHLCALMSLLKLITLSGLGLFWTQYWAAVAPNFQFTGRRYPCSVPPASRRHSDGQVRSRKLAN